MRPSVLEAGQRPGWWRWPVRPRRCGPPGPPGAPSGPSGRSRPGLRAWRASPGWPACAGLVLGLLALGPGLAPGYLLSYDMVFVPRPPVTAALAGLAVGPPQAVPSNVVISLLSWAAPADLVQKAILILIFVLSCSGAAALLSRGWAAARGEPAPVLATVAAGVCYAWNPFLAERLLIGQWALLLGYAGLPWVARALLAGRRRAEAGSLCTSLLPAAIGGFAAMAITALTAVPAAASGAQRGARLRRLAVTAAALALFSLPWLIPALLGTVPADPRGADAFAARADTPFGRLGSLVLLSGIWNAQTVPRGYGGGAAAVWLLVVLAAIGGYLLVARPWRVCPGLGLAGLAGLAVAAIGVTAAGRAALADLIRSWSGFAVLRDGQQYVAPLALTEAIGLGSGVAWLLRAAPAWPARRGRPGPAAASGTARAAVALAVMAVLAPVLLLPGLAWGVGGRLRPAAYPADWAAARRVIDAGPRAGAVLVLPWAAYRRYPWNHGEAAYDPWPQLVSRQVIVNDALGVGRLTVAAQSAEAIRLNRIVTAPGPLTGALLTAGVRYVLADAGPLLATPRADLAAAARLPGASVLMAGPDLVLFRLTGGKSH